ncbi:uncharacterized [Tachysurus ichikawai]
MENFWGGTVGTALSLPVPAGLSQSPSDKQQCSANHHACNDGRSAGYPTPLGSIMWPSVRMKRSIEAADGRSRRGGERRTIAPSEWLTSSTPPAQAAKPDQRAANLKESAAACLMHLALH